ncbi:MAG: sulfite exporter TauE/SafE family protein [Ignavibacteria bacterium]|nr:sulfite exporter TauE/SafE family protein [Ignavibacteria bacterium]
MSNLIQILILVLIGLITGGLSGLLGIGGGIIVIPALVLLLNFSQKLAQGTSLAMLLPPIGLLAAYNYYKAGYVDVKSAVILITTFIIGSYISSYWAVNLPENIIKKIFAVFLIIYAVKILLE